MKINSVCNSVRPVVKRNVKQKTNQNVNQTINQNQKNPSFGKIHGIVAQNYVTYILNQNRGTGVNDVIRRREEREKFYNFLEEQSKNKHFHVIPGYADGDIVVGQCLGTERKIIDNRSQNMSTIEYYLPVGIDPDDAILLERVDDNVPQNSYAKFAGLPQFFNLDQLYQAGEIATKLEKYRDETMTECRTFKGPGTIEYALENFCA